MQPPQKKDKMPHSVAEPAGPLSPIVRHFLSRKGGEKLKGIAAMIESKVEYAIASHTKDLDSAIEALDTCLEKNKGFWARKKL
jgi:hypothetical protein